MVLVLPTLCSGVDRGGYESGGGTGFIEELLRHGDEYTCGVNPGPNADGEGKRPRAVGCERGVGWGFGAGCDKLLV